MTCTVDARIQLNRWSKVPVSALTATALVLLIGAATSAPVSSQTPSSSAASAQGKVPLRVAVLIAPPAVMEQNGSLTGFVIDLWNAIAARLGVKTNYQIMPNISLLDKALQSKSADLSPGIIITSARDAAFDFSYPIVETGLQIMVRGTGATGGTTTPIVDMLRLLFSYTTIEWFGVALVLVLIPAHLVYFLERRHQNGIISNLHYFPGIFQAYYWGLATLAQQVEEMPRQWVARTLAIFWMFAAVVFIASYTAQLTTSLTVEQIRGTIEGPSDLPGKQVATLADSPAVDYLRNQRAQVQEFPTPDPMFRALLDQKVDAVVAPTPILLYYAAHDGKGRVTVVGPEFDHSQVAILMQLNSPLRKQIDGALVALRENGTYRQVYDKWFGGP